MTRDERLTWNMDIRYHATMANRAAVPEADRRRHEDANAAYRILCNAMLGRIDKDSFILALRQLIQKEFETDLPLDYHQLVQAQIEVCREEGLEPTAEMLEELEASRP